MRLGVTIGIHLALVFGIECDPWFLSTLIGPLSAAVLCMQFANRAKSIKTTAKVNQDEVGPNAQCEATAARSLSVRCFLFLVALILGQCVRAADSSSA